MSHAPAAGVDRVVSGSGFAPAVESPTHAGQRGKERTVAGKPLLPGCARISGNRPLDLGGEFTKERFQGAGVHQVLGFREAAQADGLGANFTAHSGEITGGAQGLHRFEDRIEQPEKIDAQVVGVAQVAPGIGPGRVKRLGPTVGQQVPPKSGQQIPLMEILIGQFPRVLNHNASGPEDGTTYKLQSYDECYGLPQQMPNTTGRQPAVSPTAQSAWGLKRGGL